MRTLKFRAWVKKGTRVNVTGQPSVSEGVMTDEFDFTDFDGSYFVPFGCYLGDLEIMQFTGLLDRNGKEIWEGDVVRCGANKYENNPGKVHKVVYSLNAFVYVRDDEPDQTAYYAQHLTEVIGNIWENPDLLK